MNILTISAVLPIVALCTFVYMKDKNKEPKGLLALIFFLGFVSVFPIVVCELVFSTFFPMDVKAGFIPIFINVFLGVALFEEIFKWIITKLLGYNNKEFDEVYDIIVYSVFASLGFACFENIMYVFSNGIFNAITRAFLSIPGHTCFAISMGFFFSKAKIAQISGNKKLYTRNTIFSLLVPIILHTFYDALLFVIDAQNLNDYAVQMIPFLIFYVAMVIVCFITVDKTAKVQQNLISNLKNGSIARNEKGYIYYTYPTVPAPAPIVAVSNVGGYVATNPVVMPVTTPFAQPMVQPVTTPFAQPVPQTVPPVVQPVSQSVTQFVQPITTPFAVPQPVPQPVVVPSVQPITEPVSPTTPFVQTGGVFPDSPVSIPNASMGTPVTTPFTPNVSDVPALSYCPICGKAAKSDKYCGRCGFKLK